MDTKWTPGPWKISDTGNPITSCGETIKCAEIESDANAFWIAQVQLTSETHGEPNARLISAAPELYDALYMVMEANYVDLHPEDRGIVLSALAKARGES